MFRHAEKPLWIDATSDDGSVGRLINHDKISPNLVMKPVVIRNKPRVVFFASKDIQIGEELSYDYGERRKDVVRDLEWL